MTIESAKNGQMIFNAYIPTKLTGIVDLIWEQEIYTPTTFGLLPSGKVELIFPILPVDALDAVKITAQENPMNNVSCFLSGLHTKPLKMTFDKLHAFGIQMNPIAVKALFGMPLSEIRNYFVDGEIVLANIGLLEAQIYSKKSFREKALWFEHFLLKKINETADMHMAINLNKVIKKHIVNKQNGSSRSIQDLMGYSRTQTYRLFNEWFGLSAQSYQKLLQFIRTVETLHNSDLKLIDVGLENNFYDQAHFIRSFQQFADMTPGEYRKKMSIIPGQFSG